jgi:hypothetical protein
MGFFNAMKSLLTDGEISFEKTVTVNTASNLITGDRQVYIGDWHGPNTRLSIMADGTVSYEHSETHDGETNTRTVTGPINAFNGASFTVGVLGQNTTFAIESTPANGSMVVNGELLERSH